MAQVRRGDWRERITIQRNDAVSATVSSLTRSGTTATATTSAVHGYATGDYVTVSGATPSGYNGTFKITVTTTTKFTYAVADGLTTPATGTIAAIYRTDAQGAKVARAWRELVTVWARRVPIRAWERLQGAAIQIERQTRFECEARADVTAQMRVLYTPTWPASCPQEILEITGVVWHESNPRAMYLECSKAVGV